MIYIILLKNVSHMLHLVGFVFVLLNLKTESLSGTSIFQLAIMQLFLLLLFVVVN